MNKRPLAPNFLNKLDNSLLLNRPDTWSTRFHLVIYYTLLFMIAFTAICFVIPTDHREKSFFELWSGSAGVLALIGLVLWLVYLLRFNVFKQYGTVFPGDRIKTFVLYFIMIAMMSLVVYIPPVVESIRADYAYTSNELATDINRMNEIVVGLERDRIPDVWEPDTLIRYGNVLYPQADTYQPGREYLDAATFNYRVLEADSIRRIGDGIVISYRFMDLHFVNDMRVALRSSVHIKSTKELYRTDYKSNQNLPNSARAELEKLVDKYYSDDWNYYYHDYYDNNPDNLHSSIAERYRLDNANRGIDHIADRKYRLKEIDYADFIRFTYYFSLVLTLFIFIFRHSTIKTFFLSLLFAVVLSILSGLFVAVLNFREAGVFGLMLFYYAAFVIVSMLIFSAKKRSVVSGIALNAFVLMTAFIPLICMALYDIATRQEYYDPYVYDAEYYATRKLLYLISEFAGGIILLILIETLFKRLYRLWYAAPED